MWSGGMTMSDVQKILEESGYMCVRQINNGEWIGVSIQIYTCGLCVGLDEFGYKRRYCYEKLKDALVAAEVYEGEGDPDGPWIKVKGEDGERMGPGAKDNKYTMHDAIHDIVVEEQSKTDKERAIDKFLEDNNGYIDWQIVATTLVAVTIMGLVFLAGHDIGRRNLVIDIDTYGCEKVITTYHGTKK
jgi:hypothetical protein